MNAAPLFKPFSWLSDEQRNDPGLMLIAEARDVTAGVVELVAMIERDDHDSCGGDEEGNDLPPLLSPSTRGNLTRLAVTSLEQLVARLDDCLNCSEEAVRKARNVSDLARLLPASPCAGMMLTAEEAAGLVALRALLDGKAVLQ